MIIIPLLLLLRCTIKRLCSLYSGPSLAAAPAREPAIAPPMAPARAPTGPSTAPASMEPPGLVDEIGNSSVVMDRTNWLDLFIHGSGDVAVKMLG